MLTSIKEAIREPRIASLLQFSIWDFMISSEKLGLYPKTLMPVCTVNDWFEIDK